MAKHLDNDENVTVRRDPGKIESRDEFGIAVVHLLEVSTSELMRRTIEHQRRRAWREAETCCEEILRREPSHVGALTMAGVIATGRDEPAKALSFFEAALAVEPTSPAAHVNRGSALHALQRPDQALEEFDRALALKPDMGEAHYWRGKVLRHSQRYEAALAALDTAVSYLPASVRVWRERAATLGALERYAEAVTSYDSALAVAPDDVGLLGRRAATLVKVGDFERALRDYSALLAVRPNDFVFRSGRAGVYLKLNRAAMALQDIDQGLAVRPDNLDLRCQRGAALFDLDQMADAIVELDRALGASPDRAEALHLRAIALTAVNRKEEAIATYAKYLVLRPRDHGALKRAAELCEQLYHWDEGVRCLDDVMQQMPDDNDTRIKRAYLSLRGNRPEASLQDCAYVLSRQPNHAKALQIRAAAECDLGQIERAFETISQSLAIRPNHVAGHATRGYILMRLNLRREALASYDAALAVNPNDARLRFNRSLTLLSLGDFSAGWREYEYRFGGSGLTVKGAWPRWAGTELLDGKTISIYSEQGYGDTLQFCRYIKNVAERGAKVIFQVQPPLKTLLAQLEVRGGVFATDEPVPPADFECPLLSLPGILGADLTNIPDAKGYLTADPARVAKWREILGPCQSLRVGLAWSGGETPRHRSISLVQLSPLLECNVSFVSLQKEVRVADQGTFEAGVPIANHAAALTDFAETAALIENVDLVITVDTAVAHLAGALGRPVWILLQFASDFRWQLKGADTPWYASARLFRQRTSGQWTDVIVEAKHELSKLISRDALTALNSVR